MDALQYVPESGSGRTDRSSCECRLRLSLARQEVRHGWLGLCRLPSPVRTDSPLARAAAVQRVRSTGDRGSAPPALVSSSVATSAARSLIANVPGSARRSRGKKSGVRPAARSIGRSAATAGTVRPPASNGPIGSDARSCSKGRCAARSAARSIGRSAATGGTALPSASNGPIGSGCAREGGLKDFAYREVRNRA